MADEASKEEDTILIKISEEDVTYESELSFIEIVFWLETLKAMMIKDFTG